MIAIEKISDLNTSIDMTRRTDEAITRLALLREMPMTDEERDLITGLEPLMQRVFELPDMKCMLESFGLGNHDLEDRMYDLSICCQAMAHLQAVRAVSDDNPFRHTQIEQASGIYYNTVQRLIARVLPERHGFWKKFSKRINAMKFDIDVSTLNDVESALTLARTHVGVLQVPLDLTHELSHRKYQLTYEIMQQVTTLVHGAHVYRISSGQRTELNVMMRRSARMASHLNFPWLDSWIAENLESLNNDIS